MHKLAALLVALNSVGLISADQTQVYNAQAGATTTAVTSTNQPVTAQQVQVSNMPAAVAQNAAVTTVTATQQPVAQSALASTQLITNKFFDNYPYKGTVFSLSVYNSGLQKMRLDSARLKKAVIIFFGDWCPACGQFIPQFAQNINALVAAGVKIIFVWVPPQNRLTVSTWQVPTQQDYSDASNKLTSLGVHLDSSVELMLLGELDELRKNGIDSLPVLLAVNNSKEVFRGGADNSLDKVNFTDQNSLTQFLELWQHVDNTTVHKDTKSSKNYNRCENYRGYGHVNIQEADRATIELNARARQKKKHKVCTCTYVDDEQEPVYIQPVYSDNKTTKKHYFCSNNKSTSQKRSIFRPVCEEPVNWCPAKCSLMTN